MNVIQARNGTPHRIHRNVRIVSSAGIVEDRFPVLLGLLALTVGAYYIGGSRFYLGDFYVGSFALAMLVWVFKGAPTEAKVWAGAVIFFLIASGAMDLANRIPIEDLYRGWFRNFVFGFMGLAVYIFLRRYGRGNAAIGLILVYLSLPLFTVLIMPDALSNIDRLFRWENGIFLALPLQFFLVRMVATPSQRLFVSAGLFVGLGAYAYLSDLRSLAALLVASATIEVLASIRYIPKLLRVPTVVVIFLAFGVGCFLWLTQQNLMDDAVYQRRDASDGLRVEMARDAWNSFIERPWIGNGSWQHARGFIDPNNSDAFIGVHSTLIQFAYEYGVLGLIYALFLLGVQSAALLRLQKVDRFNHSDWLYGYILVMGLYHTIMSPFAGAQRFTLGISLGVACSMLFSGSRKVWSAGLFPRK